MIPLIPRSHFLSLHFWIALHVLYPSLIFFTRTIFFPSHLPLFSSSQLLLILLIKLKLHAVSLLLIIIFFWALRLILFIYLLPQLFSTQQEAYPLFRATLTENFKHFKSFMIGSKSRQLQQISSFLLLYSNYNFLTKKLNI